MNTELKVKLSRGRWRWKRWCPGWEWRATSGRGNTTPDQEHPGNGLDKMFLCRLSCCVEMNSYLSGSDGALQRSLLLGQVGVGVSQPGQGGAVRMEMRLLIRRVEEPALCDHKHIKFTFKFICVHLSDSGKDTKERKVMCSPSDRRWPQSNRDRASGTGLPFLDLDTENRSEGEAAVDSFTVGPWRRCLTYFIRVWMSELFTSQTGWNWNLSCDLTQRSAQSSPLCPVPLSESHRAARPSDWTDLRSRSCTLRWCAAGCTEETRSDRTNSATPWSCCLRRNTACLQEREKSRDPLSFMFTRLFVVLILLRSILLILNETSAVTPA